MVLLSEPESYPFCQLPGFCLQMADFGCGWGAGEGVSVAWWQGWPGQGRRAGGQVVALVKAQHRSIRRHCPNSSHPAVGTVDISQAGYTTHNCLMNLL